MNFITSQQVLLFLKSTKSPLSRFVSAVAFVLFMDASTVALAADATPNAVASGGNQDNQLQEIVVTAQFRSQDVQTTPIAITAVTAGMMEARSEASVADVANRAPSVTFSVAGGGLGGSQATAINIRGVGQTDFNLALEPGVGLYIDDVYYG